MSKIKENRNFDLVEKRLTDKGKWSWKKLGDHFNVSAPRAVEIFDENKDGFIALRGVHKRGVDTALKGGKIK